MSEVLQFHCPACGVTLRIPMSAAGMEGPCPRCGQPIGAPDPRYHLPPRRLGPPTGSIQAMMERIARTRVETGAMPPEAYPQPGYQAYAAPPPFNAPAEPPRHVPAPAYYPQTTPSHPVAPPPTPEPEPEPEPEPVAVAVAVKYPPFDSPPLQPVEPPPAVIYYPWHELGSVAVPEPVPAAPPSVPAFAAPAVYEVPVPAAVIQQTTRPEPTPAVVLPPPPAVPLPEPEIPRAAPVQTPAGRPVDPPTVRLRDEPSPVRRPEREALPFSKPLVQTQAILPQPFSRVAISEEGPDGRRTILLLSCWITGIVTLVAGLSGGYYLGNRYPFSNFRSAAAAESEAKPPGSSQSSSGDRELRILPHIPEGSLPSTPDLNKPDSPHPATSSPAPQTPSKEEPSTEALVRTELENTVRGFLTAASRSTRIRYMLFPDRIRPKVEAWYANHPDKAFSDRDLAYDSELEDPQGGPPCQVFSVQSDAAKAIVPIFAMKTATSWGVDWESFVEFSEDQFARFADGPAGTSGRFHVSISRVEYNADQFPGIEKLTAYRIDPPLPGRTKYAFAITGSPAQAQIEGLINPSRPNTVVLDLAMKKASNGVSYIEISNLAARDWIPR